MINLRLLPTLGAFDNSDRNLAVLQVKVEQPFVG